MCNDVSDCENSRVELGFFLLPRGVYKDTDIDRQTGRPGMNMAAVGNGCGWLIGR